MRIILDTDQKTITVPSTVAKYVKLKGAPPIVAHTFREVVRGA